MLPRHFRWSIVLDVIVTVVGISLIIGFRLTETILPMPKGAYTVPVLLTVAGVFNSIFFYVLGIVVDLMSAG